MKPAADNERVFAMSFPSVYPYDVVKVIADKTDFLPYWVPPTSRSVSTVKVVLPGARITYGGSADHTSGVDRC